MQCRCTLTIKMEEKGRKTREAQTRDKIKEKGWDANRCKRKWLNPQQLYWFLFIYINNLFLVIYQCLCSVTCFLFNIILIIINYFELNFFNKLFRKQIATKVSLPVQPSKTRLNIPFSKYPNLYPYIFSFFNTIYT